MQAVILPDPQLSTPELLPRIQAAQKVEEFILNLPSVSDSQPSQLRPPLEPISQPQAADPTPRRIRLDYFRSAGGRNTDTPPQPPEALKAASVKSAQSRRKTGPRLADLVSPPSPKKPRFYRPYSPRPVEHLPDPPTPPGVPESGLDDFERTKWLNHGHVTALQLVCPILVFRAVGTTTIGVGSQSGSTESSNRCREIEQLISNHGRRSILNHLKTQIHIRLDQVRDAHFLYNQRLWEAKNTMTDAYNYIIGIQIRVRGVSQQVDHYLDDRRNSPASTASRATRSQADEESFFTVDEYHYNSRPQTPDPTLRQSMDRTNDRYRFHTSRPVSTTGSPPTSEYNPRPLQQSGRGGPPPSLMPSFSSDDWINRRTPPPRGASAGFSPNWLMNALPQIKITPFNGDPKEWPTFISSFRDMIHNVVPSDAQRHAFLKQLLTTEVRSYIAEYLDNPSTYYDALVELKKRYGQPQVVTRSHLMALMHLPSIRDDDSEALAKFNRTFHGAMHALRTGGYEQDLESRMTLEHVVSHLPPRMRSSWGVKVYRMTPTRATLKDLAKWIDEMLMGELMTRPSTHRSPAPQKEKKAGSAKPSTKPTPIFGKSPVVFHTSTSPPVKKPQQSPPSESNSSSLKEGVIKKCIYCDNAHSIKTYSTFKDPDVTARVEWVKEKRLCFRCLIGTHRGTECPTEIVCNIGNCGQRHHPLLHGAPRVYPANASTTKNAGQPSAKSSDGRAMTIKTRDTAINTSLAIVPVLLQANGVEIETFAFLDPGATVNLIREDVAKQLKCKGNEKISFEADLKQVSTVPTQYLKLPCQPKELMEIRSRYPHLKDVKLVDVGEPTILIGAGNQWLHFRLDERLPPVGTDAPFGLLRLFGWTCVGDLTLGTQQHDSTVCRSNNPLLTVQKLCYHVQESPTEALLLRQVEKLWEKESFPIVTPAQPLESTENELARKKFDATIQFDGTSFAERYKAVIDDYVARGFARPLEESELKGTFGRNWYLPHHGVVNPRKPEKVRGVFDASAKYQGVALNEVLLMGPKLINDIGATLLLFREKPESLSGDIQPMFLQVGVKNEDRSALRFLWRPPGSRKRSTVYEMQRQIFESWNKWTTNLYHLEAFKIPRALTSSSDIQDIQLHAFCDASTVGFGSVVYLRVTYRNNIVTVNFVTSKFRVAPLRLLTVPKLELQRAVVALRLVKFVQSTLRIPINQIIY
ncbi:Uncharacterized protein APZ42_034559 [Daphnia magna]|uniref:Peptidase A2 domain-containing protein n=1 Tax=Daphnia magna TaxID=35525 RepID=A0A162CAD1_9CRUS|nr:Uncharacterized protein APZ42_034559 [Daphnia magna]